MRALTPIEVELLFVAGKADAHIGPVGPADLTDVEAKPIFDVASTMEATFHQCPDPLLARRTPERGHERVPLRLDFRIGRQACDIHQTLCIRDRLLVERRDAHCERIDEAIEFGVWKGAIDVSVTLCEIAVNVVGAEQYFQRSTSTDQTRQARHRSAAWHETRADFPL